MATDPKLPITLYGFGFVGRAVYKFLKNHYEIWVYDPNPPNLRHDDPKIMWNLRHLPKTDHAIVCVPTPAKEDGSCDTSIVEQIIRDSEHRFYLIKSTIEPGTTERLIQETGKHIAFSPEYIGEGRYQTRHWKGVPHATDMKLHDFHIFGGTRDARNEFIELWQKVAGPDCAYRQTTSSTTAELVKYAENAYLATMRTYFQELGNIAHAMGVDYHELRDLLLLDKRISPYLSLNFRDQPGFGGKCLPKDTAALVAASKKHRYPAQFIQDMITANKRFRHEE